MTRNGFIIFPHVFPVVMFIRVEASILGDTTEIMKRTRNIYHLHIGKIKNGANTKKVSNNGDIFEVIKTQRKAAPILSHTANIYKQLYNSVDEKDALIKVKQYLNGRINSSSIGDVQRISPSLVEEAIVRLNNNKSDPLFELSSECLKNAPVMLCEQLTLLFKHYLTHGHISLTRMLSALIPLLKYKLGDNTSSDNYRSH